MFEFFKKAFKDMRESARAQHRVDKANFEAAKVEAKANRKAAKAMGAPETRQAALQAQRDAQIAAANKRKEEAQRRIDNL